MFFFLKTKSAKCKTNAASIDCIVKMKHFYHIPCHAVFKLLHLHLLHQNKHDHCAMCMCEYKQTASWLDGWGWDSTWKQYPVSHKVTTLERECLIPQLPLARPCKTVHLLQHLLQPGLGLFGHEHCHCCYPGQVGQASHLARARIIILHLSSNTCLSDDDLWIVPPVHQLLKHHHHLFQKSTWNTLIIYCPQDKQLYLLGCS